MFLPESMRVGTVHGDQTRVACEATFLELVGIGSWNECETVYAPQNDSFLLIEALRRSNLARDAYVLDMCTGSGIVAVAAAAFGARSVLAYDISPAAVELARVNAVAVDPGVVNVRLGTIDDALTRGPFDLVVANPPYVPSPLPAVGVHQLAWNAGVDGRGVLDPLCDAAPALLTSTGAMLIVQSEFSGIAATLDRLHHNGFDARIVLRRKIDFGPVMKLRATWLEAIAELERGRRTEELAVIHAERPAKSAQALLGHRQSGLDCV